jgi:hypothetical protein
MAALLLAASMNSPEFGGPGLPTPLAFEARAKLYDFAGLVRFARKIAAADNATGDLPLFFEP